MVWFAFSIEDQVEKYGAYVGIAAFFGLAVLSLLYFSQARELKRLREWAGRAPERARELEQRVVAQAAAGAARRTPSMPAQGGMVPPRRLAEMPAPPAAAQTAAGAQATELADAVPAEDEPATNGNVPAAPGAGVAGASGANGAVPPVDEGAEAGDEQLGEASADEQSADETALKAPGSEEPSGEDAVAGTRASGESAGEQAVAGTPAAGESAGEQAVAGTPAAGELAGEQAVAGTPAAGELAGEQAIARPASEESADEESAAADESPAAMPAGAAAGGGAPPPPPDQAPPPR